MKTKARFDSIAALQDLYAKGEVTPELVVADLIERAHTDAEMNIWITPPAMEHIQPYLDALANFDPKDTPLWGIPFAVKDNIDVAGLPTTAGCPEYGYVPGRHATVVARLVRAGAIPVGKTNLDQFATGLVGTRSPYGETHNALRSELISGGSSSGSSVSVARGHVVFALGTDTAGSGRVPAALNGLLGFKPSLGAWPTRGVVPACASLDCVTVFARRLEDTWLVDRVVRGLDVEDPWSRLLHQPVPIQPRRIVVPNEPLEFFGSFAVQYQQAWGEAVDRLRALRIPVERVDADWLGEAAAILYEGPWVAERWSDLGAFVEAHAQAVFPVTSEVLHSGDGFTHDAASVFQAMHKIQAFKAKAKRELRDAVLVMPTIGGTWTRDEVRQDPFRTNQLLGKYTNHCNLLDLCALAIPSGEVAFDMPYGITMFALPDAEGLLFGLAEMSLGVRLAGTSSGWSKVDSGAQEPNPNTLVAVCGLHMRGFPLESQMNAYGARFVRVDATAPEYLMVRVDGSVPKPGLVRQRDGKGVSFELEIWEMPVSAFGQFVASIAGPLGIGKVKLQNGGEVPGFVCESYVVKQCEDISAYGGWRAYVQHQ